MIIFSPIRIRPVCTPNATEQDRPARPGRWSGTDANANCRQAAIHPSHRFRGNSPSESHRLSLSVSDHRFIISFLTQQATIDRALDGCWVLAIAASLRVTAARAPTPKSIYATGKRNTTSREVDWRWRKWRAPDGSARAVEGGASAQWWLAARRLTAWLWRAGGRRAGGQHTVTQHSRVVW